MIIQAGFVLMSVAAVILLVINRRQYKILKTISQCHIEILEELTDAMIFKQAASISIFSEAYVEERPDVCRFVVFRKVLDTKVEILYVNYNPADPDDRDYKRIHAEEVAEKLNEEV